MVLGELPALRKLLIEEEKNVSRKFLGKKIELCKLEVVQLFHVS